MNLSCLRATGNKFDRFSFKRRILHFNHNLTLFITKTQIQKMKRIHSTFILLAFKSISVSTFMPNNFISQVQEMNIIPAIFEMPHQLVSQDVCVESEILFVAAHIFLDFVTLFSPDSNRLRAMVLVGRVCSMLSDYIADEYIAPDEFFLQVCLLSISSNAVVNSYIKPLSAYYLGETATGPSFRDLKIYLKIFRPFGLEWLQFKLLQKSGAIEWVEAFAGDVSYHPESDIILVYIGDAYIWEIDRIISGDRVRSCSGFSSIGDSDHDWLVQTILNPSSLKPVEKISVRKKRKQQSDKKPPLVCVVEARSEKLIFLRFDTKRMTAGDVDMDDLLQERVNSMLLQILHKVLNNRW